MTIKKIIITTIIAAIISTILAAAIVLPRSDRNMYGSYRNDHHTSWSAQRG